MTLSMFDSIVVSTLPAGSPAVAGYVGGSWPDWSLECQRFPNLAKQGRVVSIAINASEDAECLDCENGDAVPIDAPGWVKRQLARGVKRPIVYSSVSEWPNILTLLLNAGLKRTDFRVWTAHYTYIPHVCGPQCGFGFSILADATQWTDHAQGKNLDQSMVVDGFFGSIAPPHKNTPHLDWFSTANYLLFGKKLNEQTLVKQYDKYRVEQSAKHHPHRAQLAVIRFGLKRLAQRVAKEAIYNDPKQNGKPSWGKFHRGWRYQQLIKRSQGERLV